MLWAVVESELNRMGYQILENKIDENSYFSQLSAKNKTDPIYIQIERLEQQYIDEHTCYVKMVGESQVEVQFTIRLKSRDYHTPIKATGIEDDYQIDSSYNSEEIVEFIENERIFPLITKLLHHAIDKEININSINGRFLIRLRTKCNFTNALAPLPIMEGLIWIFQRQSSFNQLVRRIGTYTCHNCEQTLPMSPQKCPNCGAISPRCVICLREPESDNTVVQLLCCKSYAHKKEIQVWLGVKNQCPYCSTSNFEMIVVQR